MERMLIHPNSALDNSLNSSSLISYLSLVPDPRINRRKEHSLIDVLVIAVCTLLCAGESFNDMEEFGRAKHEWFKSFLALPNGISSHDTFNRVFAAIDPQQFLDCFLRWTQSLRQSGGPGNCGAGRQRPAAAALACLETVEKDHGRLETRRYYQSTQIGWFADRDQREGLQSVRMMESIQELNGKATWHEIHLPRSRRGAGRRTAKSHLASE
jgi:hypothetical protein